MEEILAAGDSRHRKSTAILTASSPHPGLIWQSAEITASSFLHAGQKRGKGGGRRGRGPVPAPSGGDGIKDSSSG